jgi:2-succinyl-5-enolpyruvyl-6-hydroxy-3-cyclohexene-1-carboxylate synthase
MLIRILTPEKFVHIMEACRYYEIQYEEVEEQQNLNQAKQETLKRTKQKQVEQV